VVAVSVVGVASMQVLHVTGQLALAINTMAVKSLSHRAGLQDDGSAAPLHSKRCSVATKHGELERKRRMPI
jgi:hypothetical protein